jgi:cellulose synthase operon protein C
LKSFLDSSSRRMRLAALGVLLVAIGGVFCAGGELPSWIRNIDANTAFEAVFFRIMSLPNGAVGFRRPPSETRPALGEMIKTQPHNAELYSLRALEDEQQLDAAAAESDWKAYVENSSDKISAQLALADFYRRRLRPADEIKTLSLVANAAPLDSEKLTVPTQQHSWLAFERIFGVIQAQGLPEETSIGQYRAWIARYPGELSLYARFLQFLVAEKEYAAAGELIVRYRKQFPGDQIFPVKAKAMLEYRRGTVREGVSVYEESFQPLWDPQLVKSYFDLLRDTQSLRKFRDDAHAALLANPEDLNATARIFYYYQQQGKTEGAEQAIAEFRLRKEGAKSAWTSQELYICARLLGDIHAYPEAARYYFALYNSAGMADAQEKAIAGLTGLLLTAPETPIRIGSGELSMYRDIATMDQGPGYLNGILSLILNSAHPAAQYSEEEQSAVPYFHRSRAAELLALLDARFPNSVQRPALHAQLLDFYSSSGQSDAVIDGGQEFLASFPNAPERTAIALLMADAYARKGATTDEFAIYGSVLRELAAKAQNVPLGSTEGAWNSADSNTVRANNALDSDDEGEGEGQGALSTDNAIARHRAGQSFQLGAANSATRQGGARSPEYSRVLERYLARLVESKQIPPALAVLSREIERNPDDPGLYERLAVFLGQNQLGTEQEEVYRRAVAHFSDKSWYDKLARFYLRYKRDSEFEQLTRDAVKTFQGSELEQYFNHVVGGSPVLYLRLNQYANQRFPHNPVFVRNLLMAYQTPATYDRAAWEGLLRQHWFEDSGMRNEFFEFLSRAGKLESELRTIRESSTDAAGWEKNPAAANFLAYAELWRCHFEESAPVLKSLAVQYPAEAEIGNTASSVYRSLAYFESRDTAIAAQIEDNLLRASPTDTEIMARIGDIYADREQFTQAAPYWERIAQVAPGKSEGYLEAATIYWDYFDFENALRLLGKGRERLSNPNLYAYEAGAIYENQREYSHAIDEYVKGSLSGAQESSAELRLLQLARRSKLRGLVDQSTAKLATPPNPDMPAVYLRVKVLEAQNRKPEMISLLDSIASNTTSIEQADDIETLAQQKSLETVRQHALERQAALTTDPVTRLQLRYQLIQLYESRKDFSSAQKNVEALYRDNPKILGVVRSTVDFYWRMTMQSQAIAVLLQASKDAYPALGAQFAYEAARKSTDAKQFQQARDLLAGLLNDAPYNGEYLAAMADSFAQAGDDKELEQFYLDKIAAIRNARLPADARKAQIATLRRGLIPALTRMKKYSGAVDQYIELINNFPEDDTLVTEAALYSLRYQRQGQLVDFYAKTVAQSPRDYRWSMVLAWTQTNLEDYPAAIETYAKSIAIQPDRVDLYIARSGLEERLMRFDEAAADYERIYQLAYKDPQWMEKVALVRARQGKTKDVAAALQAALIDGRPENANNDFEVARRLEDWGMLEESRSFAEQGVNKAGLNLLAGAENHAGARTYVRVMTRLRQHEQAFDMLQKALADSSAELPVLKTQMEKEGVAGIIDAKWREHQRRIRMETARMGMMAALREMGATVNTYFTPEERVAFAQFAASKRNGMNIANLENFAIPLAESAALADEEAKWRFELLMQQAALPNFSSSVQPFIDLQRRRGRFAELGRQMEQFANAVPPVLKNMPRLAAADAYRSAGDEATELRMLSELYGGGMDPNHMQRYFQLLLVHDPKELVRVSSTWSTSYGEQAANYAVAHGSAQVSHSVVQMRGNTRPAVWNHAYNALVGLYFSEPTADVNNAFLAALGDDPIGVRIAKPVDRSERLAGKTWFYYGSRYGEYLRTKKLENPDDFLPAILEESPASASGYLMLADYYAGANQTKQAIADYEHTLELSPNRPDVYDSLAVAYYKQGDRAAALAQWKQAFTVLSKQLNSSHLPESFWRDFGHTCDQLRTHHLFAELKPDADAIVRTYLRHNGTWLSNAMLLPVYAGIGDASSATEWLLDVSSAATDPTSVLADVADASWIPLAQRAAIYQRVLESKQEGVGKLEGYERESAERDLVPWQVKWIRYLILTKQYAAAANAIAALPKGTRDAYAARLVPLELRIAAQLGTLDSTLTAYRAEPQSAPAAEILRVAARQLSDVGDKGSAREILELVFAREIEEHRLVATNFLGLAEIRLAAGDTAGALDLLRRLVVAVGNPFENLEPAAALLEKTGHHREAVEFLDQLVKSKPWDTSYRVRLATARLASKESAPGQTSSRQTMSEAQDALAAIASASVTPYELRVQAAVALSRGRSGSAMHDLGSGELNLLARNPKAIPAELADNPYFYDARIRAAANARDSKVRIQLLSHCLVDFPRRDESRVPVFRSAAAARENEFALGVMEPLFQAQFLSSNVPARAAEAGEDDAQDEESRIASSGEEEETGDESSPPAVAAAQKLSPMEQAQVAEMIGDTMMRLNRVADALSYYQTARRLQSAPAARRTLLRKVASAKAQLRIERENAARQPLLHEALEQDRLVRPQINVMARAAHASKPTTSKGEEKQ